METILIQTSMVDTVAEWILSIGTNLLAIYVVIRAALVLKTLHDYRSNWNCGNLTFREARVWVEASLVLCLMFVFIQFEMIGWVYTRHICDHYRIFWAWHAMHIGSLMVAKRILRFVYRSALGQCIHSHGGDEDEG